VEQETEVSLWKTMMVVMFVTVADHRWYSRDFWF